MMPNDAKDARATGVPGIEVVVIVVVRKRGSSRRGRRRRKEGESREEMEKEV